VRSYFFALFRAGAWSVQMRPSGSRTVAANGATTSTIGAARNASAIGRLQDNLRLGLLVCGNLRDEQVRAGAIAQLAGVACWPIHRRPMVALRLR
jgi:hypothetical protein